MPEEKVSYTEFATKLKTKYPEYKDIDDRELSMKMVEKYPEYKDVVDFGSEKKSLRKTYPWVVLPNLYHLLRVVRSPLSLVMSV